MKHVFTPLILVLFGINCLAQPFSLREKSTWDKPEFSKAQILRNSIKTIHVKSFKGQQDPSGSESAAITYEYDSDGKLIHVVEVAKKDTSKVYEYQYTERGVLGWQRVVDKVWNKSYKSGYRFNTYQKVFQVKSYEMLHNDEVMLLNTKQYVYDDDSSLIAIRWLENGRVVKSNEYEYKNGVMSSETFKNGNGDIMKKISYDYNSDGYIARVTTDQPGEPLEEYEYAYDARGNTTRVEWNSGGELKGTVNYTYNDLGMLVKMNRTMIEDDKSEAHFCQVFEYEKFN